MKNENAEQPAPSQYGSPELQAMIVARAMEKNAAEQPAQHPKAKAIAECLAVLRLAVKSRFPHEQALEELVGYIAAPQPAQQEPVAWLCTDYDGKAGIGFTKDAAKRDAGELCSDFIPLYTSPPAQRKPLTDTQVNLFINGRGDEDDNDYVEPTGDGFGLTDADLVRLVRRVEAAHGIKEQP